MSYHKISQSRNATTMDVKITTLVLCLPGALEALLLSHLSNIKAIGHLLYHIAQHLDFRILSCKMSYLLVTRAPGNPTRACVKIRSPVFPGGKSIHLMMSGILVIKPLLPSGCYEYDCLLLIIDSHRSQAKEENILFILICILSCPIIFCFPCTTEWNVTKLAVHWAYNVWDEFIHPFPNFSSAIIGITPTPYMVLPLFAARFADCAGGIQVSFIQPRLF